ncbi:MAG: hypothetical protein ACJARD_001016 [Alphaproteobacteria bacterium]|jgi:hypothetical protein
MPNKITKTLVNLVKNSSPQTRNIAITQRSGKNNQLPNLFIGLAATIAVGALTYGAVQLYRSYKKPSDKPEDVKIAQETSPKPLTDADKECQILFNKTWGTLEENKNNLNSSMLKLIKTLELTKPGESMHRLTEKRMNDIISSIDTRLGFHELKYCLVENIPRAIKQAVMDHLVNKYIPSIDTDTIFGLYDLQAFLAENMPKNIIEAVAEKILIEENFPSINNDNKGIGAETARTISAFLQDHIPFDIQQKSMRILANKFIPNLSSNHHIIICSLISTFPSNASSDDKTKENKPATQPQIASEDDKLAAFYNGRNSKTNQVETQLGQKLDNKTDKTPPTEDDAAINITRFIRFVAHRNEAVKTFLAKDDSAVLINKIPQKNRDEELSNIHPEIRKFFQIPSSEFQLLLFQNALKKCLGALKDSGVKNYSVLTMEDNGSVKSEKWMLGEALKRNIDFLPKSILPRNLAAIDADNIPDNLLILDDDSFSGEQLYDFIDQHIKVKKSKIYNKTFHIVLSGASETAKRKLKDLSDTEDCNKRHINIKLYASSTIFKRKYFPEIEQIFEQCKDTFKKIDNLETFRETLKLLSDISGLKHLKKAAHKEADELSIGTASKSKEGSEPAYKREEDRVSFAQYWQFRKHKNDPIPI